MDFSDNTTFMELGDEGNFFDAHAGTTFDFHHLSTDSSDYAPVQPTNLRASTHQDRQKQQNFIDALHRLSSSGQVRSAGSTTKVPSTVRGDLSTLESTLRRVKPLQSENRFQDFEHRLQQWEDRIKPLEARYKSVSDTMTEIKKVIKDIEGQITEACETARMLTAIVQRMYPTDDAGSEEAGQA